ncbi:hypothetical protein QFW96_05000 [Saccharopolyspora sp. TS4A08]|uniref:Uncharacterized protein n=1 Tax=Saccharopolyspora ipomoeae TaxID=3042027 RepID=A0ABT6PJ22_9PSEU|nr:hypothetical protein [Saccharopolyspora sp. TS4A08]MDI2027952.1 hypothetical protein [Saccharopolyspora sp. TS4A08]
MRPAGVRGRIEELRREQQRLAEAHPEREWVRAVAWWLHGCALLGYGDAGAGSVVEAYRRVLAADRPGQQRGSGAWQRGAVECLRQLREPLREVAADPQRNAARDDEIAAPVLLRIPAAVFLGRTGPDTHFPLAGLNAAGALGAQAITAYEALTFVCAAGHYEPDRAPMDSMRALRTRYEDHPAQRPALEAEIRAALQTFEIG